MDKLIPPAVVENQTAAQETSSVLLLVVHDAVFPLVLSPVFSEHGPCLLSFLNRSGVVQRGSPAGEVTRTYPDAEKYSSLVLIGKVSPLTNVKME